MKKIQKLCKRFIRQSQFNDYRIIINDMSIVVSISPRSSNDNEIVWQVENTHVGKVDLIISMEKTLNEFLC